MKVESLGILFHKYVHVWVWVWFGSMDDKHPVDWTHALGFFGQTSGDVRSTSLTCVQKISCRHHEDLLYQCSSARKVSGTDWLLRVFIRLVLGGGGGGPSPRQCLTCTLNTDRCQYNSAYFSSDASFYRMDCYGQLPTSSEPVSHLSPPGASGGRWCVISSPSIFVPNQDRDCPSTPSWTTGVQVHVRTHPHYIVCVFVFERHTWTDTLHKPQWCRFQLRWICICPPRHRWTGRFYGMCLYVSGDWCLRRPKRDWTNREQQVFVVDVMLFVCNSVVFAVFRTVRPWRQQGHGGHPVRIPNANDAVRHLRSCRFRWEDPLCSRWPWRVLVE